MKLRVIDQYEPKLNGVLPKNHEIDLSKRVVLIVGENGTGKTSFLKMLNSSFLNNLYFRKHGVSALYLDCYSIPASFYVNPYDAKRFNLAVDILNGSSESHKLKRIGDVERSEIGVTSFERRLKNLRPLFEVDNPTNRFGYFDLGDDVVSCYPLFFVPNDPTPVMREDKIGASRSSAFDGNTMFDLSRTNRVSDSLLVRRYVSPGVERMKKLEEALQAVINFYEQSWDLVTIRNCRDGTEYKRWAKNGCVVSDYSISRSLDRMKETGRETGFRRWIMSPQYKVFLSRKIGSKIENHLVYDLSVDNDPNDFIEPGAEAVLLLDEPTIFMSYNGKYQFRKRLQNIVEAYLELKVFITTNDPVLIENPLNDSCYLDFDDMPSKIRFDYPRHGVK